MRKKIDKILDYGVNNAVKIIFMAIILAIAINCLIITVSGNWAKVLYYSDEEYQALAQEGRDIIQTSDFNREGYTCSAFYYNVETKNGTISISKGNATLKFKVKNGEVTTKKPGKVDLFFTKVIAVPVLVAILSLLGLFVIFLILSFICYCIEKEE